MKKILFVIMHIIILPYIGYAQKKIVFYTVPCVIYAVSPPIYELQQNINKKLEIEDSLLIEFCDEKIIQIMQDTCFDCKTNTIGMNVMQIVYVQNDYQYCTINMTHSVLGKQIEIEPYCFIEINGTSYHCDTEFQVVMDEIVNYKLIKKKTPPRNVIRNIIRGQRYHPNPYICIEPIPDL